MMLVAKDTEYGRNWRFGYRQRQIIDFLRSVGGASNTYAIQQNCSLYKSGYNGAQRALLRLLDRGVVRFVDRDSNLSRLSPQQRAAVECAMQRNPRAHAFWVLADWLLSG